MLDERWRLEDNYLVERFDEQDAVGPDDVIALWQREGVVNAEEAERRAHEILLVATEERGDLAGVATAYLKRNEQLRMDLWHFRLFVAGAHRMSNVAVNLALRGRDLLEKRFASGEDPRAAGMIYEIENEGLKRHFDEALMLPPGFTFIGENARGHHVRVRYFQGALAPEPAT